MGVLGSCGLVVVVVAGDAARSWRMNEDRFGIPSRHPLRHGLFSTYWLTTVQR